MGRKGKKNSPKNCWSEEQTPSFPAETLKIPEESLGSIGREDAPTSQSSGLWGWLFAAALVAAVFLAYQPAWRGEFTWNDDTDVLENPVLRPGGLAKVWVPGGYLNYWPLTFTAYWLEFKSWGLNPTGFHLVNIAVHAISALLVWRILVQLRVPGAMFAAAIFALHPVNVESVAWITQLKGLLALLLGLVSVLFFLAHERLGGWWRLALAIAAFALSALAKGMLITLPVVLLACAWWQRGRIDRRDLLRVLPYLLIGAVMTSIEVWTQHLVGAGAAVRSDSLMSRTAVAGCAVWFYLGKLVWPIDLCLVYPRWRIDDRDVLSYLPGLLLVLALGLALVALLHWGCPIVMLVVAYVALLLPALGFVNVYFMRYSLVADHYQYAAMIVPCAVFAGVAATLVRGRLGHPQTGYVLGLALLTVLAVLSWRQSRMYADPETLYRTTIDRNPACWLAHTNLGTALAARGQGDEAMAHFLKALEIKPDYAQGHYNLGFALYRRGQIDEAIEQYRKALEIEPDYLEAHFYLANVLAGRRQFEEAIPHYRKALDIQPDSAELHMDLGIALAGLGQVDDAIAHYRKALEINPDYAEAHSNLGLTLAGLGQVDEAVAHYRKALETKPDYLEAHYNLGLVLARRGQLDESLMHFQTAFSLASARNDTALADRIRARIDRYQSNAGSRAEKTR